jgi:O-acetyl-ADP-ribose deacetylase (regulator of RNase III)
MLKFVKGDIFLTDCDAIGHGCNIQAVMGGGIAYAIRKLFPKAYQEYRKVCWNKTFVPGVIQTVLCDDKIIVNMATQEYQIMKSNLNKGSGAKKEWIEKCLKNVLLSYEKRGYSSIAFPQIGCGLGGLNFEEDVKPIFIEIFSNHDLKVIVYDEYIEGVKADEN